MARLLIQIVLGLAGLAAVSAGLTLWQAHRLVDAERAPLPAREDASTRASAGEGAVRLSVANTASQPMPRAAVLDAERDPEPGAPYVMNHPSFVLEWADGRILLVDAGMDPEAALAFGSPLQLLAGAEALTPHGDIAGILGADAERVDGVVFTHLHEDHVEGILSLCRLRTEPLRVFMTEAQDLRLNHTTRPGRKLLSAAKLGGEGAAGKPCIDVIQMPGAGLHAVPGFPGLFVVDAGGHTPGSQIVLAKVDGGAGATFYAFTGDIVNHVAGIDHDLPKPALYSLLVVPESGERLAELRAWLRELRDEGGFRLLVSHDGNQLAASGLPFRAAPARP